MNNIKIGLCAQTGFYIVAVSNVELSNYNTVVAEQFKNRLLHKVNIY